MAGHGHRTGREGQVSAAEGLSRRAILSAGLLGAVAAGAAACGSSTNAATAGPSRAPRRDSLPHGPDILVGACLELTGVGAIAGTASQRGLAVSLDRLNSVGVLVKNEIRNIKLIVKDNGSNTQIAREQTQHLIREERVAAIIGGATAATSLAMEEVAETAAVPMLSTSSAESILRPPVTDWRFIFKLGPNASDVATVIVGQLQRQGASRIALLTENSAYGAAGRDAMNIALAGQKVVLYDPLPIGPTADYRPQAERVVSHEVDAVVVWALPPACNLVAEALHAAGYAKPLYFDPGAASGDIQDPRVRVAMARSYLVGPSIVAGAPREITTPASGNRKDFVDDFARRYGTNPGLAVYAADALNLVASAASRAGSATPLKIRNGLESYPYSGLAGTYSFNTIKHGGVDGDLLQLFQLGTAGWSTV